MLFIGMMLMAVCQGVYAQNEVLVTLENSSFEGQPHDDAQLSGWSGCGYNSTPDILPGPWGVYQKPIDGNTFLGLITRENNTWESIAQQLSEPLKKEGCYQLTVNLARSSAYAGYSNATVMRVWGAKDPCTPVELLATSPTIEHNDWQTYNMTLMPQSEYSYIIIECYYKEATLLPYRGNILIDGMSALIACDRA